MYVQIIIYDGEAQKSWSAVQISLCFHNYCFNFRGRIYTGSELHIVFSEWAGWVELDAEVCCYDATEDFIWCAQAESWFWTMWQRTPKFEKPEQACLSCGSCHIRICCRYPVVFTRWYQLESKRSMIAYYRIRIAANRSLHVPCTHFSNCQL